MTRKLTVTMQWASWATYEFEVADDFDTADLMAMNELFDENGPNDGTAESVITIDKDEQVEEVE